MNIVEQCREAVRDPHQLDAALNAADTAPLLMSLVHLTGQTSWLDKAEPYIKGGWSYQSEIPAELGLAIRHELKSALASIAQGRSEPVAPDAGLLGRMMDVAVGQKVPDEYRPIFYEETQIDDVDYKKVPWRKNVDAGQLAAFKVIIIGAGLSGIGMAIKLSEAGIPYEIFEKNREVGGTWFENTYPGVAVDTPNHFFSYSFALKADWSRYFSRGEDIQKYILDCVERYDIRKNIRFEREVESAHYDQGSAHWILKVRSASAGEETCRANVIVTAVGALNRPAVPNLPGLDTFEGKAFHTARWDKGASLEGKRVALIGTGASGIQVGPTIAPIVEKLTIFQRAGHWIIRHPLYHAEVGAEVRWAMAHVPYYMKWFRFQLFYAASDQFHPTLKIDPNWTQPEVSLNAENHKLRGELIDYYKSKVGHRPDLMAKVVPGYPPFGKRLLRDNHWFDMLLRDNVDLVTDDIARVERDAIVTKDGTRHPVDVIVLATGFQAARMLSPMEIVGRDGSNLREIWGEDNPRAYLGISAPRFPNLFMLYGPNTNLAHGGSAIFHSECQIRYVMQCVREMIEIDAASMECKEVPFESYNAKVDKALSGMVWSHPGVTSWYKNKQGRVIMNSPWRLAEYRNLTEKLRPEDYEFTPASGQ